MDVSTTFNSQAASYRKLKTYHVGALESASHRSLRQLKDKLLKTYDLTSMEWYIVGLVSEAGDNGIRTTDLANTLGTTMGFLTKSVNLLNAKRILYRKANEDDARSSYIVINPDYIKITVEIEDALRARLREVLGPILEPGELETYVRVMQKVSNLEI